MPEERQMPLPGIEQIVTKSNAFCRARWSAETIFEPRIIACVASRVNPDDADSLVYDIRVSDILGKNYTGLDLERLRQATKKVISRVVEMKLTNEKGWGAYPLLTGCEYREATGILTVSIHPKIRPHFLWLKDNVLPYTQYDLHEYMQLPSMYSQRVFEILKSWKDKPEYMESVDNLHEMLGTPKSYRDNFKAFRVYVLEKSRRDIHKHTSLRFTWEVIKTGRRISNIRFIFSGRRIAESKLEDAKKKEAKALANSRKTTAAYREAKECAREKGGVCSQATRAKRVCAICNKEQMLVFYAEKCAISRQKTQ